MDEVKKINEVLTAEPSAAVEDKSASLDREPTDEEKEEEKKALDDEALMGPDSMKIVCLRPIGCVVLNRCLILLSRL